MRHLEAKTELTFGETQPNVRLEWPLTQPAIRPKDAPRPRERRTSFTVSIVAFLFLQWKRDWSPLWWHLQSCRTPPWRKSDGVQWLGFVLLYKWGLLVSHTNWPQSSPTPILVWHTVFFKRIWLWQLKLFQHMTHNFSYRFKIKKPFTVIQIWWNKQTGFCTSFCRPLLFFCWNDLSIYSITSRSW